MASSSWNQQGVSARRNSRRLYKSDWVYELRDSTILELSEFCKYFYTTHHRATDIVVIYQEETNNPYGFGFVANDESDFTGGTFRTDVETATMLRNKLLGLATELSKIHASSQPQRHMGEGPRRKYVNYIQFPTPSLLLEHQFSHYFNDFPASSYSVVLLFDTRACGFGFLQNSPSNSYMNHLRGMVEELKATIYGGLASISRSFLGQGVGSSVQQQQQQRGGGRGSAETEVDEIHGSYLGQGVTGSRMAHSVQQQQQQQRGERGRGSATAIMGQPLIGSFSGVQPNPTQWPGRENVAGQSYSVMQQQLPQFAFHSQETTRVFPHEAINRPFRAPMWRGPSAGVTSQVLSVRPAGQQETNQWSGSTYGSGFSPTVMQQQQQLPWPSFHSQIMNTISGNSFRAAEQLYSGSFSGGQQQQPSLHSQATVGVFPHEALNRPSSAHMWSGTSAGVNHQVLSARAGQLETNLWYGGGYNNTMMQQPGPSNTQTTNTTSGSSFGATGQLFSGSFAGGQQQQLQQRGERGRGSAETEIQRAWVPELTHTSTMNLCDFNQYFYNLIQPAIDKSAIDMVIIYNNDNTQCGFGFVVNEMSIQSGGHFRTVPYWEDRLKMNIAVISNTLKNKHCTGQALKLPTRPIDYAQLQSPLISALLQQSQIIGFFKNLNPTDDFRVVALLPDQPCGFGFIQVRHISSANADRRKYLDELRPLVHQLMITIDGAITAICSRTFTPPAAVRPLSVPLSGSYSSSVDGVMQHQLRSQSAAAVVPYEETNTPSESRNEAVMQQQQHPDSAGAKRPGQNGNT